MSSPIIYFFLLLPKILFNFILDIVHKCNRFFKALFKEVYKFVLDGESNSITIDPSLIVLLAEADLLLEK